MKKHLMFSAFIVITLMVSLIGIKITQAQDIDIANSVNNASSGYANLPWFGQYVHSSLDPAIDVGGYNSLAYRPFDDVPYMSYYDASNGNLTLAHLLPGGGGNCGTGNMWHCEALDGTNGDNVGNYTSLAFWADESAKSWKIGISYHDVTNRGLKFVSWTCGPLYCTIKNIVTIDSSTNTMISHGLYTSLKFSPDGTPHIAYYTQNILSADSLRYASYVGSGGNCGEGSATGKWNCTVIDAGEAVGQYASMDLTYDGSPYIAYYDGTGKNLKVAYYLGIVDIDCNDDNGWECKTLDSTGDVGLYTSITAQHKVGDKLFRVAYYDKTNGHLKYYDPSFLALVVDDMNTSLTVMGISMDIDSDGYPIIAYQEIADEFSPPRLLIARPFNVFNDGSFGNCGDTPPGYMFTYWRCKVLDNAGQYVEEADFISTAVNSSGLVGVAYSEYDSYYVATSLKYTGQKFATFLPISSK
jgi:hypothetical protein